MAQLAEITEERQRAFFDEALACWGRAADARGEVSRTYDVAGTRVRLRFAGDALVERIVPALEHLRVDDAGAEAVASLDVCLFDTANTGVTMAQPPCPQRYFTDRGNIWGFDSKRVFAAFQYGEFSVSLLDREARTAVYWVHDASRLPFWTTAAPLRTMLSWVLKLAGKHLVHGAVVGTNDGAVLVTGRGGSGKSSTALTCLAAGLAYIGDDYVGVGLDPPTAFSLYSTAKLTPEQARRFAMISPEVDVGREGNYEKAVFFLRERFSAQLRRALPLRALTVPSITGMPDTTLAPVDRLTIAQAAAFTTIAQLPHTGQSTVDFVTRMADAVPFASLRLGTDREGIVRAIEECARGGPSMRSAASSFAAAGAGSTPESERLPGVYEAAGAAHGEASHRRAHTAACAELPLVSVVIPVHDGEEFVAEAVASVTAQQYPWTEILLVDDASTDGTAAAIDALAVEHRRFRFETNQGPAEARNRGVREAAGDYVAFLDVDDLWPPRRLERMVRMLLEDPCLDIVTGRARLLERDESGEWRSADNGVARFPYYIGAGVYRRRAFLRNGPFDRAFRFGEDTDWYLRAFENGVRSVRLDEVTLLVRRHGRNMTRGKTDVELNQVRVFKARLDRLRTKT